MNTFIAIAWRSVWRNKRRSILTISMLAFGLFISTMPAEPAPYMFITFSLLMFALALIAALYPAIKAAQTEPLEAIKHT